MLLSNVKFTSNLSFGVFSLTFILQVMPVLEGCSSTTNNNFTEISDGKKTQDITAFYWYNKPNKGVSSSSGADYLRWSDQAWYKTEYVWRQQSLREVVRIGQRWNQDSFESYKTHLRFSAHGEPVFQRYELNGAVIPLTEVEMQNFSQEAAIFLETYQKKSSLSSRLYQGFWDGNQFTPCNHSNKTLAITLAKDADAELVQQWQTHRGYVAFLGTQINGSLKVSSPMLIDSDSTHCINRPIILPTTQ